MPIEAGIGKPRTVIFELGSVLLGKRSARDTLRRGRSDLPGSGPARRSSSSSSARRLIRQECRDSHEVVGEHSGANPQFEAVASFGETALHAAASEQHRDAALDAGAKALTILECGAALVRFAPRCSLAAPLRNAHQLDASVLARCKVLLTEEAAIRAI